MNPIGEIISIATCLLVKVLMINKMSRTGQKLLNWLRSLSSRVNQSITGLPATWEPGQHPPSRDAWPRGGNTDHCKGNGSFSSLALEKVEMYASFVHVLFIFFFNSKSLLAF